MHLIFYSFFLFTGDLFCFSAVKDNDTVDSKYALDVVKGKLLGSLNALENGHNLGYNSLGFEEHHAKQPLSVNAVAEGPRLRLLWASFQQIEEEVGTVTYFFSHYGHFAELLLH